MNESSKRQGQFDSLDASLSANRSLALADFVAFGAEHLVSGICVKMNSAHRYEKAALTTTNTTLGGDTEYSQLSCRYKLGRVNGIRCMKKGDCQNLRKPEDYLTT